MFYINLGLENGDPFKTEEIIADMMNLLRRHIVNYIEVHFRMLFSAYLSFPFPRLQSLFSSFPMPSSNAFLPERDGEIATLSLLLWPSPSMYSCIKRLRVLL